MLLFLPFYFFLPAIAASSQILKKEEGRIWKAFIYFFLFFLSFVPLA